MYTSRVYVRKCLWSRKYIRGGCSWHANARWNFALAECFPMSANRDQIARQTFPRFPNCGGYEILKISSIRSNVLPQSLANGIGELSSAGGKSTDNARANLHGRVLANYDNVKWKTHRDSGIKVSRCRY